MKLIIRGALNQHSGYGRDSVDLALAFRQAGADVYLDPSAVQAPLPLDVAELLTKRLEPPFDLLLHHWDPSNLGISEGVRKNTSVTVAHTMYEFTSLDNCPGRSSLRRRLRPYDLVVGYDAVSTGALAPYVTANAATVQGGYWPRRWPGRPRDWNGPLRFCMVGQLGPRKDPFLAIDAFKELRAEQPDLDMELHLKGQPLNAPVLTPSGWVPIGLLEVGDRVVDPLGGDQKVLGVQELGEQDIYEVVFRDGSRVECTADHLWQVRTATSAWRVKSLEQIIDGGLRTGHKLKYEVPLVVPPDIDLGADRELDPYLLGLLLGDGGHTSCCPGLSSADKEIIEYARAASPEGVVLTLRYQRGMLTGYEFVGREGKLPTTACVGAGPHAPTAKRVRGLCRTCYTRAYRAGTLTAWRGVGSGQVQRRNIVGGMLLRLGLRKCHSWEKFIPEAYKLAPAHVRLELLRGLMDTDGTQPTRSVSPGFTSTSRRLADDVRDLVRSLGGTASICKVRPTYTYKGVKRLGRPAYRVGVSLPVNPFRLPCKAQKWEEREAKRKHRLRHAIVKITRLATAPARCILVSGVEGLYVTSDYVVTHNTNYPGLHSRLMDVVPGLKIYYEVWPEEVLRDFYYRMHVLLAPSRGEGKNLPALEMLSTGGSVIATSWGGHEQWLSPTIAYPLNYTLGPVSPTLPNCLWAKADKEHLKQLMLHCYHNRAELARKGELAADLIPAMCAWPKAIDRLMERVGEISERGERVLHKYRVAKARQEQEQQVVWL